MCARGGRVCAWGWGRGVCVGQAGVCTELPPAAGARWSSPHSGTSEKAGAAASGAALLHPPSGTSSDDGDLDIGPGSAPAWPCACGKDAAPPRLCFLPGGCHAGPPVRVQTGAVPLPPLHPPASAPELLVGPRPARRQAPCVSLVPSCGVGGTWVSHTGLGFRGGSGTGSALQGSPSAEGMSHTHTEV